MSEGLFEVLGMPVSDGVRADLEALVGKLPKNFTWADGCSLGHLLATFGKLKGFKLDVAREVREAVEGKSTQRMFVLEPPQQAEENTPEARMKRLWAWLAETEFKRHKLFDLPIPEDTAAAAKKLGISLDIDVTAEDET